MKEKDFNFIKGSILNAIALSNNVTSEHDKDCYIDEITKRIYNGFVEPLVRQSDSDWSSRPQNVGGVKIIKPIKLDTSHITPLGEDGKPIKSFIDPNVEVRKKYNSLIDEICG